MPSGDAVHYLILRKDAVPTPDTQRFERPQSRLLPFLRRVWPVAAGALAGAGAVLAGAATLRALAAAAAPKASASAAARP